MTDLLGLQVCKAFTSEAATTARPRGRLGAMKKLKKNHLTPLCSMGPILPVKKRKHLSKLLSKHLKNFNTQDPEELEDKTLEIPEVVAPAPQVAQQVEGIQEPEISPLQD